MNNTKPIPLSNRMQLYLQIRSIVDVTEPQNDITRRRSTRKCNEPVRFRDYSESISETSDTSKFYKIRRILGQRQGQNAIEYFVQFKGEPAQNAIWIPFHDLNRQTQKQVILKPPPKIT